MPALLQADGANALVLACSLLITGSVFVFLGLLIRLLPLKSAHCMLRNHSAGKQA
jgi:hypothetical protein